MVGEEDMNLKSRNDFPRALLARGFHGRIAEVGVDEGVFSRLFYETKGFREIVLIDPWQDETAQDSMNYKYATVSVAYSKDPRVKVLRYPSVEAAKMFEDGAFDFVYIDALHDEAHVYEDCMAWFPKVRKGGVLAGHDLSLESVHSAMERFSLNVNHIYHKTEDTPSSWYLIKEFDK
jgi:hypothetical protein